MNPQIILASSSPFRKQMLERLHLSFSQESPHIDESHQTGESASAYVRRLAQQKARTISKKFPHALIIGSDQCALLEGQIIGKPGNHENAMKQLKAARGNGVTFHAGLCVYYPPSNFEEVDDIIFKVWFRHDLSDQQLSNYLTQEQPYQCAGSFKSEGYGVCLMSKMQGDDPSALIGLPLIRLISMLEHAGVIVV